MDSSSPFHDRQKSGTHFGPIDNVIEQIASYVAAPPEFSSEALSTATLCLQDSIGCGILALSYGACTKMLGPMVPHATLTDGARVPGTQWQLEPVQAAFNIGCMIRWLDYNDTWLAAEWGHPSDNFGAILALADYLDRNPKNAWVPDNRWTILDVLNASIAAYEIQGVLALHNSFNRVGLDHVLLVRVASTAVACSMLGGNQSQIADAVSHAWLDGGALRTYRHAPNTGSRKSWAAGDATRRGVQLALWTMAGELGYATPLTAPRWGFQDVVMAGKSIVISQPLGCYTMENILFKVSFPAEFHAQTAAEAAMKLSPSIRDRIDSIREIGIHTQESAVRIIDKKGALKNPADRDHCIQYIVAVALLHGDLSAEHYEDSAASDPRIDRLREKMTVIEDPDYSRDYLDPSLRSIANRIEVIFNDGTSQSAEVQFPLGHRRRREESRPRLLDKFQANIAQRFDPRKMHAMLQLWNDEPRFWKMRISEWMDLYATESPSER
ncbi:MAG: bifunctional 2-methylcitrate dehydratase/aconitate hydratase [Planctomycetes bacterium]|nr:bifunctional 2-methylcitrate dehydratase/aconitate hydratase [Planctomycetota bacterium]